MDMYVLDEGGTQTVGMRPPPDRIPTVLARRLLLTRFHHYDRPSVARYMTLRVRFTTVIHLGSLVVYPVTQTHTTSPRLRAAKCCVTASPATTSTHSGAPLVMWLGQLPGLCSIEEDSRIHEHVFVECRSECLAS